MEIKEVENFLEEKDLKELERLERLEEAKKEIPQTAEKVLVLDLKSKILFSLVLLAASIAIVICFWKLIIKKDYLVFIQIDCDPAMERCFVGEEENYYKILERKAFNIPLCDPKDESCEALVCKEQEADCSITYCSEENVSPNESCNNPEEYKKNNPENSEGEVEATEDEERGESEK